MSFLPYSLDETRERETAHIGREGRPNPWWPGGNTTNDCVGYQTERLGLRTGNEVLGDKDRYTPATRRLRWLEANRHMISIAAFRAHYQWPEVPAKEIQPGDLVLSNWEGGLLNGRLEPEHMEWAYSRSSDSLVIIGANTGPRPGEAMPNGVWKKSRPLNSHIVLGIRPPYRDHKPTRSRKHVVQTVARYVNDEVTNKSLRRTTAAGPGPNTGLEGPNYWRLVQTWGRDHGYYPSKYVIDGIPGPQTRIVEAAAYKAAVAHK